MGSEMVMVDGIAFPPEIAAAKPLALLGHGINDIEIHFLQIKFTAIGVYLEKDVVKHLEKWKGKKGSELKVDEDFFEALVSAPVGKLLRIVVIKEIKGSQYGTQLESAVRDRLAAVDKFEEEEEEALEKIIEFFQSKYFKKDSVITMNFPTAPQTAEITFATEGKEEAKIQVGNANVAEMIQKWYLGGTSAISPTTVESLAENLGQLLCQ
uniref:Chalcone-flavonone isomerase family protein n=1 Tax=Arisaema heterophyllum TaxID=227498 RepID=A0A5B8HPZ0_9ARAE|nr:chalcone isomerase [Arisaema heterophyllum]